MAEEMYKASAAQGGAAGGPQGGPGGAPGGDGSAKKEDEPIEAEFREEKKDS
jgi:hypothetical protein